MWILLVINHSVVANTTGILKMEISIEDILEDILHVS